MNQLISFAKEIIKMNNENEALRIDYEMITLKMASYKCKFYGNYDLAQKIDKQFKENENSLGLCYDSDRADAVYRTLFDMLDKGIITEKEYDFCLS